MSDSHAAPFQALHNAKALLKPLLYQHATIATDYEKRVREIAAGVVAACAGDSDAVLASVILDNPSTFTVNHAVHVAAVAAVLGAKRGLLEDQLENLAAAALTMNMSIAELQDTLANQQAAPNALQKSSIESHAKLSNKLLGQKKIKQRDWLNAVMQHHERFDGTGPLGMRGDAITELAQILTLADRYVISLLAKAVREFGISAAFFSNTIRPGKEEEETLRDITALMGSYHPGLFVRLANDEIGVVLRCGEVLEHPPVVSLGAKGALSLETVQQRDTADAQFAVAEVLDPKMSYNKIKLCRLWGYPEVTAPPTAA